MIGRGTEIGDQFLKIRPGGELARFQMLNRLLLEAEDAAPGTVLDYDFIASHRTGYNDLAGRSRAITWERVLEATGLPREEIEAIHDRRSCAAAASSSAGRAGSPSTSMASPPSTSW